MSQVTIIFAPTLQTAQGPRHEQVTFDGGVKDIEYPHPGKPECLLLRFEDGTTAVYNWAQVREVLLDPVGKVRPDALAVKLA